MPIFPNVLEQMLVFGPSFFLKYYWNNQIALFVILVDFFEDGCKVE